jgi:hypothetical protein
MRHSWREQPFRPGIQEFGLGAQVRSGEPRLLHSVIIGHPEATRSHMSEKSLSRSLERPIARSGVPGDRSCLVAERLPTALSLPDPILFDTVFGLWISACGAVPWANPLAAARSRPFVNTLFRSGN